MRWTLTALVAVGITSATLAWSPARTATRNPLETHALAAPLHVHGHVTERLRAGPYVYLQLTPPDGPPVWVASLRSLASDAADIDVTAVARADTFPSRRLGRTFTPLLFGAVRAASSPTPTPEPHP
jgi:hypothetical protein